MNPDPPNSPAPVPLDYGAAPPRRRKIIRRTLLAMCLIGASLATWRWGPGAWRQAQILYWQRQCMTYAAAEGELVYDGSSTLARPECLEQLINLTGLQIRSNGYGGGPPPRGPIIFLGELQTPSGKRRLVVVEAMPGFVSSSPLFHFKRDGVVIDPGGMRGQPRRVGYIGVANWIKGYVGLVDWPALRIYAGQRDPTDPGRFTIRYTADGFNHMLDGRIDDQDKVILMPYLQRDPR